VLRLRCYGGNAFDSFACSSSLHLRTVDVSKGFVLELQLSLVRWMRLTDRDGSPDIVSSLLLVFFFAVNVCRLIWIDLFLYHFIYCT
jgi:hypothetical protein